MTVIGVFARSASPNYNFVACDSKQSSAITAYIPLVRATRAAIRSSFSASPEVSRRIAHQWIDGANAGVLGPLEPCAFDDTSREGLKSDIIHANIRVAEALALVASHEKQIGQPDLAAKDAALGALTLQVTKFSDFSSVSICSMVQRRCLREIKDVALRISPTTRAQVERQLQTIRDDDSRLSLMAIRTRQLFLQYRLRHGVTVAKVEATQKAISPDEFTQASNLEVVAQRIRASQSVWQYQQVSEFLSDVRLGYQAQADTDRKVDELFDARTISL